MNKNPLKIAPNSLNEVDMQHNFPTPRKIFHFLSTFSHDILRAKSIHLSENDPYTD